MDYEGNRMSIVYFSVKGSLQADPDAETFLSRLGFPLPGPQWLQETRPAYDYILFRRGLVSWKETGNQYARKRARCSGTALEDRLEDRL